eukprot:TRINITY_DN2481_c1_g1_i1.p1 TRINITY_DN2481_c1_g1~~TRINITY_DN2481_c1_g1_i1.p1  ORF type:complete len:400 (-),score=133.02 TRINITY_DN2481_c1_g1_i1:74-1273(-)
MSEHLRTYGLKYKARCMCAQRGNAEKTRFFIGTMTLREENQVHLIQVEEDEIICQNLFGHPSEVWCMTSSPDDPSLLFTSSQSLLDSSSFSFPSPLSKSPSSPSSSSSYVSNNTSSNTTGENTQKTTGGKTMDPYNVCLWKLSSEEETNSLLHPLLSLHKHDPSSSKSLRSPTKQIIWEKNEERDKVVTIDESIRLWRIESGNSNAEQENVISLKNPLQLLHKATWSPHFQHSIAAAVDNSICAWDTRSLKEAWKIEKADLECVRDLNFNSNKMYHIVSCGDDSTIKFWDVRNTKESIKVLSEHNHWVWNVEYNPMWDQFLISSGTDNTVNLWNITSLSSDEKRKEEDKLVKSFDQHQDSVYSTCWSASDNKWLFASLSYDGRVAVNSVPREEQLKVVL